MSPYLVDITRTISRIGRGFATGIDRVEIAYLKYFIKGNPANLFIAKLGRHTVVIDQKVMSEVMEQLNSSNDWGWPTLGDAVRFKLNWEQRCARSFLKRRAVAKVLNRDVSKLMAKINASDFEYLNVGHSNLSETVFSALRLNKCKKIHVLIHDMIPLDHPEFSQRHIPKLFERRMRAVAKYADRIICNSDDTRKRVAKYFAAWGCEAEYVVSHLGIEQMEPSATSKPPVDRPYFVVLGTIEPRKNHILLFKAWERLEIEMGEGNLPYLFVVGRRGWDNIEAFQFLDESMLAGKYIIEQQDLNDKNLADLLFHSNALLFPSFVEGFGLPALEAAQLGVPVICSDLDTFKEILGDEAVYLDPESPAKWQSAITQNLENTNLKGQIPISRGNCVKIPTWHSHFRHVFSQ